MPEGKEETVCKQNALTGRGEGGAIYAHKPEGDGLCNCHPSNSQLQGKKSKAKQILAKFIVCVTPGDGSWRLGSDRENLQVAKLKQIQQTLCDLKETDS